VPFEFLSARANPSHQEILFVHVNPSPLITIGALEENKDLEANLLNQFWTSEVPCNHRATHRIFEKRRPPPLAVKEPSRTIENHRVSSPRPPSLFWCWELAEPWMGTPFLLSSVSSQPPYGAPPPIALPVSPKRPPPLDPRWTTMIRTIIPFWSNKIWATNHRLDGSGFMKLVDPWTVAA
jgi:hypothetical protein